MGRHWEAPRIAYELAAEYAERLRDTAAGSGGARGQYLAVGEAWQRLRLVERRDVLDVLGTQARAALWELRGHLAAEAGQLTQMNIDLTEFAARACERARGALEMLASPQGGTWAMPECPHCQAVLAVALIDLQCAALRGLGADPAAVLRSMARTVQARDAAGA